MNSDAGGNSSPGANTGDSLPHAVEKLGNFEGPEFLLPGRIEQYHSVLEDAYGKVETTIDEIGQELEYQHARLDKAVKHYGA